MQGNPIKPQRSVQNVAFSGYQENSVQFTRQVCQGAKIVGNPVYNENRKKVAFARPQQELKVIHLPLLYPQTFFCKERQECEAGLVYRSYCIDTTTVYSPNSVKVSTYQRPRHLLPQRVFFLDSLGSEAPAHQRRRFRWLAGSDLSPFCSPWRPQRWPAAPKASGPGVRQRQVARRCGLWGVLGCTCSCGWTESHHRIGWCL